MNRDMAEGLPEVMKKVSRIYAVEEKEQLLAVDSLCER